jgi:RimJ/RimL family protein N-acetyltransferase
MQPAFMAPPPLLRDDVVSLEPLTKGHAEALFDAASGGSGTFALTRVPASLDATRAYIDVALAEQARGLSIPFATRDLPGESVVGTTRFMTMERWSWPSPHEGLTRPEGCIDALEIGATWLAKDAQRTAVNTHAKLLMLTHAFEVWGVRRVMLKTDARNTRSRDAILRIGATFDGVQRAHMPGFDGQVRDTAYFSILAAEWAGAKVRLLARV